MQRTMAVYSPASSTVVPSSDHRPASIRSVASSTSTASAVSLTRRSRTRTRARTLTGGSNSGPSSTRVAAEDTKPSTALPYFDRPLVANPGDASPLPDNLTPLSPVFDNAPPRPPRSPQRLENAQELSPDPAEEPAPSQEPDQPPSADLLLEEDSSSPQQQGAPTSPDTHVVDEPAENQRDSVLTQQSFSSSSIYPLSTSRSPTDSRSAADPETSRDVEPEVDDTEEFDGDDVSYRLRLLVNNNYFLPPAHSKPSASDFAHSAANASKKSPRSAAPTFLDLFRVGRSRLTPSTPPEFVAPVLRTTSDSTTASGHVVRSQTRSLPTTPVISARPGASPQDRTGRVVVVREKMTDIITAAKQAEHEMKTRNGRRDQGSQRGQVIGPGDVIDPTDAVDLPPPSAGYPFAVQASAAYGLGVEDSVGAALLAERLPPRNSPGYSPEEFAWRKALLHEAVNHSLQNSPAVSIASPSPATSIALTSPMFTSPNTPTRAVSMKRMLGQRIIDQPLLEQNEGSSALPQLNTLSNGRGRRDRGLASPDSLESLSKPPSHFPRRAESPTTHHTPLAPPPRRFNMNPLYSLSQSDLTHGSEPRASFASSRGLRKVVSSPRLTDAYESEVRHMGLMTPPPIPAAENSRTSSRSRMNMSFETSRAFASVATTTDSHYSDEGQDLPRDSTALSISNSNRPSLSEYSQPSPTASAFQDALNFEYQSPSPRRSTDGSPAPRVSDASPGPRYSTMSPPPRVSSSLANIALSPPPRSSSLQHRLMSSSPNSSTSRPSSSDTGYHTPMPELPVSSVSADRIAERRQLPTLYPIQIPNKPMPVAVHSAPPPSSPTSFFDHLQTYPNAMDDLESSSDEDETDSGGQPTPVFENTRPRAVSNLSLVPSTKPSLTRLGNYSTPYVSRSYERRPCLPIGPPSQYKSFDPKKPIGNVPLRPPYFNDRKYGKSDQGHGHVPPTTAFDIYRYKQQHSIPGEPSSSSRPSMSTGVSIVRPRPSNLTAQESLRRLDGMLIQHMEAERDTIKRIATSVLHTKT